MRPHRRQPTRLPRPWDSPGKNTGVGCHFLLQCMKVKSTSEVAESCPTPSNPMDCSLPGSSVHGIFQANILEWVAISYSWDLPNPGIESVSLASPALAGDSLPLCCLGIPHINVVEEIYYRNCLTQLWRLRSPTVCHLQAEEPRKPKGWEYGALMTEDRRRWMSQFKNRKNSPFLCLYVPTDWMMPTHTG